jgi:hypothetical protein
VTNPDEDTFILRGWKNNPITAGKTWQFVRDEERYDDKLLHCTVKIEQAKSFVSKETKFYRPDRVPIASDSEEERIARVQEMHEQLSHASSYAMIRVIVADPNAFNVTVAEIKLWKEKSGNHCTGCIEGAMKQHAKIESNKPLTSEIPGELSAGDLMFIETKAETKKPLLLNVDVATKLLTGVSMRGKDEDECTNALLQVKAEYAIHGRKMQTQVFDRESGMIPAEARLKLDGIKLDFKAAGQKVALAEVNIREVRIKARSAKAGVRSKYNYLPPNQFNVDLVLDSIQVLNRIPKEGKTKSPYELFTGKSIDYLRDMRVDWGEPVIVERPRGIASDLTVTGQWAVVVRRIMNGTGVLKVYLIQQKKYAYRLKFQRARAPQWVMEALSSISKDTNIGFEDALEATPERVEQMGATRNENVQTEAIPDEAEEVLNLPDDQNQDLIEAITQLEEIEANETEALNQAPIGIADNLHDDIEPSVMEAEAEEAEIVAPETLEVTPVEPEYRTRYGRVVRKPERYRDTEKAYAIVREVYEEHLASSGHEYINFDSEFCGAAAILYQDALKKQPSNAKAAFKKEIQGILDKNVWTPVHLKNLTEEERKMVISNMKNFVEKLKPDNTFDKFKVRVLFRGDLQREIGQSEGPVCRIESLKTIMSIAAYEDYEIFTIDITGAYLNTPMPDDVKHKWMKLDKDVVDMLLEIDRERYESYVRADGTMVVRNEKLMYGYQEAAHYWYNEIAAVFRNNGFKSCMKDKCVFVKTEGDKKAICGLTVDDGFFAATRDEGWIEEQVDMLRRAFKDVTVTRGDELGIIGMHLKMDRKNKRAILSQPKWEQKVIHEFETSRKAPTPALTDLMAEDDEAVLLKDQRKFMSLNSLVMYGATRTYAEILPATTKLASKYNKATEADMKKLNRVAEYIYGCAGRHEYVLAPKSLQVISCADAAYATHADAKSHTGGTVGFESDESCWTGIISGKQSVVAKSTGEAELIAENKVGDLVEWKVQLMEELGYPQKTVIMLVDSTCAMNMVRNGTGSFKRAKHIKVRYFWLKDLIDDGIIKLEYQSTHELVADILTKPLTGAQFQYLLYKLIGWNNESDDYNSE